ncbi:MAG TPA: CocE/NonD family hydrolase [Solirubrobacterales bacterium]|nr:CocE/NonD family hydrolase [Solirubrobacterales bacterium]
MKVYRGLFAALVAVAALVIAPVAQAAPPTEVFGGEVECNVMPLNGDITACSGKALTWDGTTKIDVNVFLPPESVGEGPFPMIGDFHGWGGSKQGLTTIEPSPKLTFQQKDPRIQHWAESGYAVFSMSDRGWGKSCGKYDIPEVSEAVCANGYNHLMDDRYEVRDAQYLMSVLAAEGLAVPNRIGVTGASYGGGISVALAALRNREMEPDGTLVPWESPAGEAMEIAAAVPQWAWTDIAYALAPNGRNLDYVTESTYRGPSGKAPIGVMKYSYTEALYQSGLGLSTYSTSNPEANIPGWRERLLGGEPYTDAGVNAMIEQLTTYHSAFYINHSEAPAPLLLQSGWNDDLFPVDEALRLYQRTRAQYPGDPISLFLADYGHARSQNKEADVALFNERLEAWFAHYLKGEGAAPSSSVEALTTTCPASQPSEGPFKAADWAGLSPGEIRLHSSAAQTIQHGTVAEEKVPTESSAVFDPIVGPEAGKTVCSAVSAADNPRAANYRLAPAPAGGYTLMGSPTIVAQIESPSPNSEIAARLVDESPEGTETLIARGLYRPVGGSQEIVFQLHPQGYRFAAGHVAKLELLPSDFPYGRFSNLQTNVTVDSLELRLPVMNQPGSLGGLVQTPQAKVVPAGYQLAAEFETKSNGGGSGGGGGTTPPPPTPPAPVVKIGTGSLAGRLSATRGKLVVPMQCGGEGACSGKVSLSVKRKGAKKRTTVATGSYSIAAGKSMTVRVPLTKAGKKLVGNLLAGPKPAKWLYGQFVLNDSGRPTSQTSQRAVQLPRGK